MVGPRAMLLAPAVALLLASAALSGDGWPALPTVDCPLDVAEQILSGSADLEVRVYSDRIDVRPARR